MRQNYFLSLFTAIFLWSGLGPVDPLESIGSGTCAWARRTPGRTGLLPSPAAREQPPPRPCDPQQEPRIERRSEHEQIEKNLMKKNLMTMMMTTMMMTLFVEGNGRAMLARCIRNKMPLKNCLSTVLLSSDKKALLRLVVSIRIDKRLSARCTADNIYPLQNSSPRPPGRALHCSDGAKKTKPEPELQRERHFDEAKSAGQPGF